MKIRWVLSGIMTVLLPAAASGQEFGVLLGVGRTDWSGSAAAAWQGTPGLTLGALTAEWQLDRTWAGRLELGGGARVADLGQTGLFAQETRVSVHRVHLAAIVRPTWGAQDGRLRTFVEGGAIGWLRTLCDVDLEGGPGFFGGETVDCAEWVTEDDLGPLIPAGSGLAWTLGAGVRTDRWAFGIRYETDVNATIGSPRGEARPRVVQLTGQWVFASRGAGGRTAAEPAAGGRRYRAPPF